MFAYRGGLYNLFEEPNEKGSWVIVWTSSEKSFILLSVYEIWLSGTGRGTEDGTLRRQVTGKLVHFALVLYIDWQAAHLLTDTQAPNPPSIPQTHTAPVGKSRESVAPNTHLSQKTDKKHF